MIANPITLILMLILFLLIITLPILLQVFLCRMDSKWPGLILPIISFLIGLLSSFNMVTTNNLSYQVLFYFIPSLVFSVIYVVIRRNRGNKKTDELRKMRAQDL